MADAAKSIPRVGHLRMDVDRLGRIFAEELGEKNFTKNSWTFLADELFFQGIVKLYLNSLAKERKGTGMKTRLGMGQTIIKSAIES